MLHFRSRLPPQYRAALNRQNEVFLAATRVQNNATLIPIDQSGLPRISRGNRNSPPPLWVALSRPTDHNRRYESLISGPTPRADQGPPEIATNRGILIRD